jgi:PRTRC genetic system ThiF family protein
MIYEHHTHPALLAEPVTLALVGAGGNGSQMLTGLARLHTSIRALGHPGLEVIVYDPDDVSEANLGRQLFAPADVGRSKAAVLVTRVNAWYGTRWAAVPARFQAAADGDLNIIVSCVDSAAARVAIGKTIKQQNGGGTYYWLDLGNRAADGQAILGIPAQDEQHEAYAFRLPTVLELFPELATDAARLDRDDAPSCSLAQALERQELFVNQAVVTPALQLLWQIFRYGRTTWCGAFVNLRSGRMSPLPVDPDAWERFGHHAGRMRQTHWTVDTKGRKTVHERRHPMSEEHRAALEDHARDEAEEAATIEVTT